MRTGSLDAMARGPQNGWTRRGSCIGRPIFIRGFLAGHRSVVWRDPAALLPHKPVRGGASSESVLPHSAGDGSDGMSTFQCAIGGGSPYWHGAARYRRMSGKLANRRQIVARLASGRAG